ncbi:DNA polymerase III subunit gamma/tau [Veillonella magna]|uniref:DNA polymerase III subunit gamma/tau n=1 Tax=Veillonella magna TaxID=464322 RepID=UPI0023F1B9CC|nr:DNA polymerase III subunit gamma/tau [Veillonella magna]MBD8976003.1 DNA polymerase III subunit gamma/tau [Veillonella magna]
MSYMALYRRWRPKDFTDVVGQKQVSETLMRAIREDKVAHAYLFSGPRGTGKTSIAKIFARAINCEKGPTDHPCNECTSCKQILEGRSMDVLEIDAASNRGIDEVRALRESAKFMPVEGRKKIFIIDEAHMLTNEAWNALLKTIEEPPAHIMFIFATTEPEKIPVTILSRCQRYTFRRITAQDITEHLLHVAEGSGIQLDPKAARLIAVHADGGLRDALSILDQCSGMTDDVITIAHVESMIGLVSKKWVIDMVSHIMHGDGAAMLLAIQSALSEGRDTKQMVSALTEHLRALLVAKVMPAAEELQIYDSFKDDFQAQVQAISVSQIDSYVRALQSIQNDAKRVDNPRTVIEVGLLALAARARVSDSELEDRLAAIEFRLDADDDGLKTRLSQLEHSVERGVVVSPAGSGQGPSIDRSAVTATESNMNGPMRMTQPQMAPQNVTMPSQPGSVPPETPGMVAPGKVGMVPPGKTGTIPPRGQTPQPSPQQPAHRVGQVPPPAKASASPVPNGVGAVPPQSQRETETHTSAGTAPTFSPLGTTSSGVAAEIGEGILPPGEYRGIQGRVLQWMQGKKMLMSAGFYRMGQLIYVDNTKAVIAFNTDFNVKMATTDKVVKEATQAFSAVMGHAVTVLAVGSNTPEDKSYRAAARGGAGGHGAASKEHPAVPTRESAAAAMASARTGTNDRVERATANDTRAHTTANDTGARTAPPDTGSLGARKVAGQTVTDQAKTGGDEAKASCDTPHAMRERVDGLPADVDDFGSGMIVTKPSDKATVDITKLPKWDPNHCREEELANPVLLGALAQAAADGNDIYVEVIDDDQEDK